MSEMPKNKWEISWKRSEFFLKIWEISWNKWLSFVGGRKERKERRKKREERKERRNKEGERGKEDPALHLKKERGGGMKDD